MSETFNATLELHYKQWLDLKKSEAEFAKARREVEASMVQLMQIDASEAKSQTINDSGYKVVVSTRVNRRIDADLLQQVAQEKGVYDHLSELFTWKPSIKAKAWEDAPDAVKEALASAITETAGKPTFNITKNED